MWPWEAGFWKGFNQKAEKFKANLTAAVRDRIDNPGLLLNDLANTAQGLLTFANDITGISNIVTGENKTAEAIVGAVNAVIKLPSMSSEERGAVAATATIIAADVLIFRGKATKGVTVVGEGMARVEAAASKIPGAKILNDMPKFTGTADQVTSQMMTYNRQWILKQMRSGRPILDIGRDLNRANPSIFYQMEQNMMKNYLKLHPNSLQIIKP